MAEKLQERLKSLPAKPGVYLFRDTRGDVLYVGKAKSLRSRVRSYFRRRRTGVLRSSSSPAVSRTSR